MLLEVCGGARSRGAAIADGGAAAKANNDAAAKADDGTVAPVKSRPGSPMTAMADGGPTPSCTKGMHVTGRDDASFFGDTLDGILRRRPRRGSPAKLMAGFSGEASSGILR
jgi:hypothetical protein